MTSVSERVHVTDANELPIFDLDRVLISPDLSMARLGAALLTCELPMVHDKLEAERARIQNDGGTFAPYAAIRAILAEKMSQRRATSTFAAIQNTFHGLDAMPIVYPNAQPLLQRVRDNGLSPVAQTYTREPEWQWDKIEASGLGIPADVSDKKNKSAVLASRVGADNKIEMPTQNRHGDITHIYRANTACIVEDKMAAVMELPPGSRAIVVHYDSPPLPSQLAPWPPELYRTIPIVDDIGKIAVVGGKLVVSNYLPTASSHGLYINL